METKLRNPATNVERNFQLDSKFASMKLWFTATQNFTSVINANLNLNLLKVYRITQVSMMDRKHMFVRAVGLSSMQADCTVTNAPANMNKIK